MSPSQFVSTEQAARALGVSVSTIKRWVDEGVLPAHRTPGGHRKLLAADILRLSRQEATPPANLGELAVVGGKRRGRDDAALASSLLNAVLRGDEADVQSLVDSAYRGGLSVENLADQVVAPVMHKLGCEWESNRLDVWQEHRGTQACVAAIHRLQSDIRPRNHARRPLAVGAAPSGDQYLLPSLLAQLVLTDAGWNAVNLGPDTPFESLADAVRGLRPRLVWVSASHIDDADTFLAQYHAFHQTAEQEGAAVAVGGRALVDSVRGRMSYTSYGDGLSQLASFARTLHPPRKRPRRGRPVK